VLCQNAEADERSNQRSDGSELINEARREMPKVVDHGCHRNVVLDHVAQQLEKREDLNQRHQGCHQHAKVKEKSIQDIAVNQHRPQAESSDTETAALLTGAGLQTLKPV